LMSAARACGLAPTWRVVGYSTGISPVTSRSRRTACSCTGGKAPGAANDGDSTAMRSPGRALGGGQGRGACGLSKHTAGAEHTGLSPAASPPRVSLLVLTARQRGLLAIS
jgi:hypothetical protein